MKAIEIILMLTSGGVYKIILPRPIRKFWFGRRTLPPWGKSIPRPIRKIRF